MNCSTPVSTIFANSFRDNFDLPCLTDYVTKETLIYDMTKIDDILNWCEETGRSYWEYVERCEGPGIWDYLKEVWEVMKAAVERGIEAEGVLPGGGANRLSGVCLSRRLDG